MILALAGYALWPIEQSLRTAAVVLGLVLALPSLLMSCAKNGLAHTTTTLGLWQCLTAVPFVGKIAFSGLVGVVAPYSASVYPHVVSLSGSRGVVQIADRPWLRNPFQSLHAVALTNVGELASGLVVVARLGQLNAQTGVLARGIVGAMTIEFHKKARGTVTATCDLDVPTTPGKHTLKAVTFITDTSGARVATFGAEWAITISHRQAPAARAKPAKSQ